jgi:EmrB/QacA subfamily drug resistance transporter
MSSTPRSPTAQVRGEVRGMSRGSKVLVVTVIGASMTAIDTTIVNVARDTLSKEFGSSASSVSWVWSAYSIVFAAVLLTSGRLADRYGRKRMYTTGLWVFIVASAVCGAAPTLPLLIAARTVQAVGGALLIPAAMALLLPEFPPEKRSTALGIFVSINSLAAAVGPVIGGALIDAASWRAAFLVNVPIGLTAIFAGRRILVESRDELAAGVPDPASIASGIGSVGILALVITQGNDWGYGSARSIVCYAAVAVLLMLFTWRSRVARLPVLDLHLLHERSFTVGNVSTLLFAIPFYGSVFVNVSFFQQVWHYSPRGAGLASLPGPIFAILLGRQGGRWCDRHGHRWVTPPAALLLAGGVFGLAAFATVQPAYWTRFAPFQVMIGTALGILIAGLQSASVRYVPPNRLGMASAFNTTLRQVGAALAVSIAVAALSRRGAELGNFDLAWTLQGVAAVAVAVLMWSSYRATLSRSPQANDMVGEQG